MVNKIRSWGFNAYYIELMERNVSLVRFPVRDFFYIFGVIEKDVQGNRCSNTATVLRMITIVNKIRSWGFNAYYNELMQRNVSLVRFPVRDFF